MILGGRGMGDLDVSATVIGPGTVDAEIGSFDGRLNAWLTDFYSNQADACPPAFIDLVED